MHEETSTEEFARLLDEAESHRLRVLPFDELRHLARLYRGESARLSRLRDRGSDLDRIAYLNALCVRGHGFLYSARDRQRPGRSHFQSLVTGLARSGSYVMLAWAVMAIGAFIGFFLVRLDPSALYALMPAGLGYEANQVDALYTSAAARDAFFARDATSVTENAFFGSFLLSHNTKVGILAFSVGVLWGLPTILLQFYNGLMIGSMSAIFIPGNHALLFIAWILPHGVPELTAITLCTAGGLALGHAVSAPGRRTRAEALRAAAAPALALALSSMPLFFAAAWIESFVRESALETPPRLAVAAAGAAVLVLTTWLIRQPKSTSNRDASWLDELLDTTPDQAQAAP